MRTVLSIEVMEDANWLGGSIYIGNLLAALSVLPAESCPRVRLRFLSSQSSPLAQGLARYSVVSSTAAPPTFSEVLARLRRLHRALVRRLPGIGHLWSASDNELYFPAFDATQQWRKNLFWIPDFQPLHLPELFEPRELAIRTKCFKDIAYQKGILLLSSRAALADFQNFYPEASIVPRVWSFCSSVEADAAVSADTVARRYALPAKFLYIANQFWRHKDHATAFEALKILRAQGLVVELVCTGLQSDRRDPDYFHSLQQDLIRNGLQHQVHFLGLVPRDDQVQIFRLAAAVLQPSRFEGWSTVIEDAKALGRPIIASDIAVHREQLVGVCGAHLFKAASAFDLAHCIAMQWTGLQPGPDIEAEILAAERRNAKRLTAAYQFVNIFEEAIAYPRSV